MQNAYNSKKNNMREEKIWLSGLQDRRFLRLGNRNSQSMKSLFLMFRNFMWVYLKEKGKKEVYCLFPIIIFLYLCSK